MARARNIKPGIFTNDDLAELPIEARFLFIGLWTMADREGRLEDRPKRIKMTIFPADSVDVEPMLSGLAGVGAIVRYEVEGRAYIWIPGFAKHQKPHHREAASTIPAYQAAPRQGKAVPRSVPASPDSLNPSSLNPDCSSPKSLGGKPPKVGKSPRKPDLIFEAIATACGIDWTALTKNERGALNNAAAQLREIGATPDDIEARAAKYRQKWPGIDLTPMALVNNWNTVVASPDKVTSLPPQLLAPPHIKQNEYDSLDRRGKLDAWKQWEQMWEKRKNAVSAQ